MFINSHIRDANLHVHPFHIANGMLSIVVFFDARNCIECLLHLQTLHICLWVGVSWPGTRRFIFLKFEWVNPCDIVAIIWRLLNKQDLPNRKIFITGIHLQSYALLLSKPFTTLCTFGCDGCAQYIFYQIKCHDRFIELCTFIPQHDR